MFVGRSTHCIGIPQFLCDAYVMLPSSVFGMGEILGLVFNVLWNDALMPHSGRTLYPEPVAAIINCTLLISSILVFRKSYKGIKVTSRSYPKVTAEELAKGLGAGIVTDPEKIKELKKKFRRRP